MSVRSAQTITIEFTTCVFSTGVATNADSLPTGTLVVNGVDNAASVTVTNIDAGRYKAAVTLPTLAVGDTVELSIAATVSTVAGKAIVWRDTKDMVIDSAGLVDANTVKLGPSGSGSTQTARDIGLSVLVSAGNGTGQLDFTSGVVKANATQWLGGTIPAVNVTGVPKVDVVDWLGTAPLALSSQQVQAVVPSSTVVASVTGAVGSVAGAVGSVAGNVSGNVLGSVASVVGGVVVTTNSDKTGYSLVQSFPANFSSLGIGASGHILVVDLVTTTTTATTATNLTNAPTLGDFTTAMKATLVDGTIADKILGRNLAGGSDGGRMVKDALRATRNKVAFDVPVAGQFTVYAEDDTTPAWTGTYTSSSSASPVTVIDPA